MANGASCGTTRRTKAAAPGPSCWKGGFGSLAGPSASASAGADPSRFLLWVHDVRNGSKPCVSESSRRVESFQLSLGAPGGKSGWNVSWIETDSGNSFALPVDAHGVLSTRAFVGDGVLVGR